MCYIHVETHGLPRRTLSFVTIEEMFKYCETEGVTNFSLVCGHFVPFNNL